MKRKRTKLVRYEWIKYADNLFFYKDKKGIIWQLLRTPFKEIPKK